MIKKLIIFLFVFGNVSFANQDIKPAGHRENIKSLLDSERESYSSEIEADGIFLEPEMRRVDRINGDLNNGITNQAIKYNIRTNIGYEFSKYFTGFINYDFGKVGFDPTTQGVNLDYLDYYNLNINGIGSKINIDKDFNIKVMYIEDQFSNSLNESNINRSQEVQIKATTSF